MTESRYEFAYRQAAAAAVQVGQLDFCETLHRCLFASMAEDITESRAVEMLERFEYYCKALSKIEQIAQMIKSLVLK